MKGKIEEILNYKGYTQSKLAEILETQPGNISHMISGRSKPGFELLQKIFIRFPEINPDWLLLDKGPMLREGNDSSADSVECQTAEVGSQQQSSSSEHSPVGAPIQQAIQQTSVVSAADALARISERGDISRIIVLYADHSFESFTPKR